MVATALGRLATLVLYLRVFTTRFSRYFSYGVIALIAAAFVVCFTLNFALHLHRTPSWVSLPNAITDVLMLIIPLPSILKLNANFRMRIGLIATFVVASL